MRVRDRKGGEIYGREIGEERDEYTRYYIILFSSLKSESLNSADMARVKPNSLKKRNILFKTQSTCWRYSFWSFANWTCNRQMHTREVKSSRVYYVLQ